MYIETKVKDGYIVLPEDEKIYVLPEMDELYYFAESVACLGICSKGNKTEVYVPGRTWGCQVVQVGNMVTYEFYKKEERFVKVAIDCANDRLLCKFAPGYEDFRDQILYRFEECWGIEYEDMKIEMFA